MQIYVERGVSKGDCLQKIVNKYGIRFTILREKTFRPSGIRGLFAREGVELEFCLSPSRGLSPGGSVPSSLLPEQDQSNREWAGLARTKSAYADDTTINFLEEKKRVLAAAGKNPDQVFQQVQEQDETEAEIQSRNQLLILDKLEKLQEKIETGKDKNEHPGLARIAQMLRHNDFSEPYMQKILEKARKELPLETLEDINALQDHILGWIGESIKIFPIPEIQRSGQIIVLVGPTGVGKTTTIAKLAVMYGPLYEGPHPLTIRMFTIDAYKIGAEAQIGKYGDMMEIPVSYIDNYRDLRRDIDLYREETDLILIDTIGRSPKDSVKLGEMKEILDACGSKAEIHLALAASTKTSDMEHILQQFEPFNYRAVILTKLDETRHVGNVISALAERGKPISYITAGQEVHKNIHRASVIRFLVNLEEFRVNRDKFERQFPATAAEQLLWG